MALNGKNILFIAPKYFDYEKYIKEELEQRGAKVYLIYENIKDFDLYYQFRFYCMRKSYNNIVNRYYSKQINKIHEDIDIIFTIRIEFFSEYIAERLKKRFPLARWVMYQWDSVENNKNVLDIEKYFEYIYTFDSVDANKYGWIYRPLFFIEKLCNKEAIKEQDLVYIGTLHSNRIDLYNKIKMLVNTKNQNWYHHLYASIHGYFINKYILKKREYQGILDSEIKFRALSLQETNTIYDRSKIIVDYAHPGQTGFTMRTIESVGHKCKLITNNIKIKDSDIYHSNNIYIYDLDEFSIPNDFFETEYEDIGDELYYYYSLSGFIDSILGDI